LDRRLEVQEARPIVSGDSLSDFGNGLDIRLGGENAAFERALEGTERRAR
jgi:hypothetical protein